MKEEGQVRLERDEHYATLWLSNPTRRNAMTQQMWLALEAHLQTLWQDRAVRLLLLRGEGGEAFSAGADIGELQQFIDEPQAMEENNWIIRRAQLALEDFPKPTVALIEGACFGGGFGLALACDFRFASSGSRFAVTPAKLGLVYSLPDTRRMLRTLGPTLTRELLMSARVMEAEEAHEKGFLTALLPADTLVEKTLQQVALLADGSASALSGIKRTLNHLEGAGDDSLEDIDQLFSESFRSHDCREGAAAFLEKRPAVFNREDDTHE